MSSAFNSPRSTSGDSRQKFADSISTISRTTSHFNFDNAFRWSREFGAPTAGFFPIVSFERTDEILGVIRPEAGFFGVGIQIVLKSLIAFPWHREIAGQNVV